MDLGDHFKQVQPKLFSSEDKQHILTVRKEKQLHKLDNVGLQCKRTLTQADIKPIYDMVSINDQFMAAWSIHHQGNRQQQKNMLLNLYKFRIGEKIGQLNSFFQCVSGFDFVRVFLVLYSHIAVTSVHVGSVQLITELTHVVFLVLWSM